MNRRRMAALAAMLALSALPAWGDPDVVSRRVAAPDSVLAACDPAADYWEGAGAYEALVVPQNVTTPMVMDADPATVTVQSVNNGAWILFRLRWPDATRNANVDVDRFSDQVAIQWPVSLDPGVNPFMGDSSNRVHIVHWKAIWQDDLDKGYQDVQALHPNFWSDFYYMSPDQQYPYPVVRTASSSSVTQLALLGIHAGNPVSQPDRSTPVEEVMARGFGTLTTQPRQNAAGRGAWADGAWTVVIARQLVTDDGHDAQLVTGREIPTAIAMWDGGLSHVGARKRFAPWFNLVIEGAQP